MHSYKGKVHKKIDMYLRIIQNMYMCSQTIIKWVVFSNLKLLRHGYKLQVANNGDHLGMGKEKGQINSLYIHRYGKRRRANKQSVYSYVVGII